LLAKQPALEKIKGAAFAQKMARNEKRTATKRDFQIFKIYLSHPTGGISLSDIVNGICDFKGFFRCSSLFVAKLGY